MTVGFVVVGTLKRGALKRPEPLDDANQWRAFSAWRMSEAREMRAEFESGWEQEPGPLPRGLYVPVAPMKRAVRRAVLGEMVVWNATRAEG